jgi:3-oxoacyl-[acyl-carrier protein] reductase
VTTALVTGGARGIGRAAVRALVEAGFDVAIASLERAEEADLDTLRRPGRRIHYHEHDVANIGDHAALVARVTADLGPIDCLVNNAGVTSRVRGDLLELTPESFDRCVAVNLRGTFFLTQCIARAMIAAPAPSTYRSIITVTSVNADIVGENRADYCITKAGSSMASKLFAARLAAERIHVFEIRPGIVRTDMTAPATDKYDRFIAQGGVPLARWGEPDDVGTTVATIARGLLPFATGEVLNVGGGVQLHRI